MLDHTTVKGYSVVRVVRSNMSALVACLSTLRIPCACSTWWNIEFLQTQILNQDTCVFLVSKEGKSVGILIGGVIGLRGRLFHLFVEEGIEDRLMVCRTLLFKLECFLSWRGIHRAHLRCRESNLSMEIWKSCGYHVLDEYWLEKRKFDLGTEQSFAQKFEQKDVMLMPESQFSQVRSFMSRFPEVAWCEWENEQLLVDLQAQQNSILLTSFDQSGTMIGALFGGVCGRQGMINHVAVAESHKGNGVGKNLLACAERIFVERKASLGYLLLTGTNDRGYKFWTSNGYEPVSDTWVERDF